MFQSPGDIAFRIFNMPIYFYGIIMAFSIFVGVWTAFYLYKIFYNKQEAVKIFDFSPFIIILGIVGARLYYCIVNFSYYSQHPLEIFNIRQGGLSIHGMIILGIILLYAFSKVYKMAFFKLCDTFLCATALAQSIGRWGNFFNSEAFGTPCDLPWKLFIPLSQRPVEYLNYEYFHPTFLYESILDFFIFLILILSFKRLSKKPGIIACIYLILYSCVRIFVEYFRVDSVLNIAGLPIAQIISICLIIFSFICLYLIIKRKS